MKCGCYDETLIVFLPAARGQVLRQPVELRDVLPTLLDAASASRPTKCDGASVLPLFRGGATGWREWIDLEHDVCYSPANHWNALTDGRTKYIYHAQDGEQQLFDLVKDPHETRNLAGDSAHAALLGKWRTRLVEHFAERGEPFLKNGDLQPRPQRQLYSPQYPRT
jgi:arylsulfatase A-like enzyme